MDFSGHGDKSMRHTRWDVSIESGTSSVRHKSTLTFKYRGRPMTFQDRVVSTFLVGSVFVSSLWCSGSLIL